MLRFAFSFLIASVSRHVILGHQFGRRISGPIFGLVMGNLFFFTREAVYSEISEIILRASAASIDRRFSGGSQVDLGMTKFLNSLGLYLCVSSWKKSCSLMLLIFRFLHSSMRLYGMWQVDGIKVRLYLRWTPEPHLIYMPLSSP